MFTLNVASTDPESVAETLEHYADLMRRDPHHFAGPFRIHHGVDLTTGESTHEVTGNVVFSSPDCEDERHCRC